MVDDTRGSLDDVECHSCSVMIVGGGPTGLTLSALLSQYGIASILVEAHPGTCDHPQGHVVNSRSCEIFRALGCLDEVLKQADLTFAMNVYFMTGLAGDTLAMFNPTHDRERVQARLAMSPCVPLSCPQDILEPILADQASQGPGQLWFSAELVALEQNDAGAVATIMRAGQQHKVASRWVVGCDGAASPTRHMVGITMEGPESLAGVMGIYFHADLSACLGDKPAVLYWVIDGEFPATVINLGHNRYVAHVGWDADTESVSEFSSARCAEIVDHIVGDAAVSVEIRSVRPWVMTAQIATAYRQGSVFLAGDAAHRFPPTGGFGLNTGVQDAHNLAWKLALVDQGCADEKLLDTYQPERQPVAAANSDFSLRNAAGMSSVMGPGAKIQGQRLADGEVTLAELSSEIQTLLDKEAGHFDPPGRELGYLYTSAAVVPDGSMAPEVEDADRDYIPCATPGARAPHMWVQIGSHRCSTLDLFYNRFTVLTDVTAAAAWRAAAEQASVPVTVIVIGEDVQCDVDQWQTLYACHAVLVRPDGHVAWRAATAPPDIAITLEQVLGQVMCRAVG